MDDEGSTEADALAGMPQSPPRRKAYSYSGQLTNTPGNMKRQHHYPRNHSLDEINILSGEANPSDDEEFYRYSNTTSGGVSNYLVDQSNQRVDGSEMQDGAGQSQRVPRHPLPEFMGAGGGVGVYKVPIKAAVHPNRPPCLELRPHPLRETQIMGRWYEIASFLSRFQPKSGVDTRATCVLNPDGTVHVLNETWSDGKRGFIERSAYKADPNSNDAKLKVKFYVPPFLSIILVTDDYWVLYIDEDYQYALIG